MTRYLLLPLLVAVVSCRTHGTSTSAEPKVIGGVPAGDSFPSVDLLRAGPRFCSGTFISREHFLTAAHCLRDESGVDAALDDIRVGTDREVPLAINIHPGYGKGPLFDTNRDIAVLTFSPKEGRAVSPVARRSPRVYDTLTIVGFGPSKRGVNFLSIIPVFTKSMGKNTIAQFTGSRIVIANHSSRIDESSVLLARGDSGGGWFNEAGELVAVSATGAEKFSEAVLVMDPPIFRFIASSLGSSAP